MPNLLFRLILLLILMSTVFFITACGADVSYTPPFGLVTLKIGTGGITVAASSPEWVTPVGTFAVDVSTSLSDASNQQPPDNGLLLTIRYYKQGTLVDDVYQMNTGGSKVVITTDGHTVISIESQRVFIDASQGNIQTIEVTNADSTETTVTDNSTPYPTLAGSYSGDVHDDTVDEDAGITLTSLSQDDQGNISGTLTCDSSLVDSGSFTGYVDTNNSIQFTVTTDNGYGNTFNTDYTGTINSDGSLSGTYTVEYDDSSGSWQASPN